MTIETFLLMLDNVTQRGSRWSAKCPAHEDRSPSLSISEGDKGILVKCWANCSLDEICRSLGISPSHLFLDVADRDPQRIKAAIQARKKRHQDQATEAVKRGRQIDALKAADFHVQSRRGLDISKWTNLKLHLELNRLADAYNLLATEEHDAQSAG